MCLSSYCMCMASLSACSLISKSVQHSHAFCSGAFPPGPEWELHDAFWWQEVHLEKQSSEELSRGAESMNGGGRKEHIEKLDLRLTKYSTCSLSSSSGHNWGRTSTVLRRQKQSFVLQMGSRMDARYLENELIPQQRYISQYCFVWPGL